MKSIRTRIARLTIIAISVVLLLTGTIAFLSLRSQSDIGAEQFMSLSCEASSTKIDSKLKAVEQSVATIADYVDNTFDNFQLVKAGVSGATGSGISVKGHDYTSARQQELDAYIAGHLVDVEQVFNSIATQSDSVLSYYCYVNTEITQKQKGFLNSRINGGDFAPHELTDIEAYAYGDQAHIEWYYLPQESGRPVWIGPYYDQNQGIDVVSYIAPLYTANTFIGIVGMDIAYEELVQQIADLEVLTTGYAFLTDAHGYIVYHPTLPAQMSLGDVNAELESAESADNPSSLITYTFEGVEKKAAWKSLSNGMHLFVCAPTSEINERSSGPILLAFLIGGIALIVLVVLVMLETRRITRPLEDLTEAANKIADGNYDMNLTYNENDEVGILTNSFRHLIDILRVRMSDLYAQAYKDALTSVRNKAAYDAYIGEIDAALSKGEHKDFALVAFDCNELKYINDTYGHDRGDAYLKNSCQAICKVFNHSPVFRVGGDEFVCVLIDDPYEKRDEFVAAFWEYSERQSGGVESEWQKVNLAMGVAVYDPTRDKAVLDVARRADDLMYQNKHEYKARKYGEGYQR